MKERPWRESHVNVKPGAGFVSTCVKAARNLGPKASIGGGIVCFVQITLWSGLDLVPPMFQEHVPYPAQNEVARAGMLQVSARI